MSAVITAWDLRVAWVEQYFIAPHLSWVPIREIRDTPTVSERQLISLDIHSFRNILHQIDISIRTLSELSSDKGVFQESLELCKRWSDDIELGRIDMDISELENSIRSSTGKIFETVSASDNKRTEYIQITGILWNLFAVFQSRWREYVQRRTIKNHLLYCTADEIKADISEVFRIMALNSRGRYGIVFDPKIKTPSDYLIDIRVVNHKKGMVARFPYIFKDIIRDLIANSRKYSPVGTEIHCLIRESAENISFSVSDAWYGIPDQELEKAFFEYGYRGSNIRNQYYWNGIGLLKATYYTKRFWGSLYVRTQEVLWTEIVIVIPKGDHRVFRWKGTF